MTPEEMQAFECTEIELGRVLVEAYDANRGLDAPQLIARIVEQRKTSPELESKGEKKSLRFWIHQMQTRGHVEMNPKPKVAFRLSHKLFKLAIEQLYAAKLIEPSIVSMSPPSRHARLLEACDKFLAADPPPGPGPARLIQKLRGHIVDAAGANVQ